MNVQPLTDLYHHPGPFVSIYLDTSGAVENAGPKIETRWKDVLRELDDLGVDEATREALTAAKGDDPQRRGGTLVMFAGSGRVHYARSLPDAPSAEVVRVAPLPYLLPLLDWAQTRIPHVVVLTDRQGADIMAYTDEATPDIAGAVDSGRYPYHKTGDDNWSELHFQHKVEENWKASAKQVAETVADVVHRVGARLIIAAGDVHALQLLREELPTALRSLLVVVDGGRTRDGSDQLVAERVIEQLARRAATDGRQLLDEFGKYRGRAEKAGNLSPGALPEEPELRSADGLAETVNALRQAQVATLLVSEALKEDLPVYYGPEPVQLGLREQELAALGVQQPAAGPAVDVLVRAALATDAQVRLVAPDTAQSPSGGVGALLRYGNRRG